MPRPKGRPKATPAEGGLDLGVKKPRAMASKKVFEDEQGMKHIYRRLELLESVHAQGALDEKVQKVLSLHAEAEEENKHLRDLLMRRGSSSSNEFETPDRKPDGRAAEPWFR